jgi:hypothetical protein
MHLPAQLEVAMRRAVLSLCALFVVVLAVSSGSVAEAQPISRNNPFRSFNLSGVNYGSQQWEREHRGKSSTPARNTRLFSRPAFRGR